MKQEQVPTARVRGSLPPLASPRPGESPDGVVLPLYTLYSPGQVALATFLGTPLAGSWLLARNFKKLGAPTRGWFALVLGVVWSAGLIALAIAEKLPGIISLASIPAMVLVMRGVQGRALDRHHALGGGTTSWGYAVAGALVCVASLVVATFCAAVLYALLTRAPGIEAPQGGEVLYTEGATEADAIRLRDALGEMEYWGGAYTVQVHRDGARWVVSFAVTDETLHDPKAAREFGDLSEEISKRAFSGEAVDVVLMDEMAEPRKRLAFEERLRVHKEGDNEVRYRDISEAEARTIANVMVKEKFTESALSVTRRYGPVRIELWTQELTPTPVDDLRYQSLMHIFARALDAQIDLVLGDFEGDTYARYEWAKRVAAPVIAEDGTRVFHHHGGTALEAQRIAPVVAELDTDGFVAYALIMRDENHEPARPVIAVWSLRDPDDPELTVALRKMVEPLSKAAFEGRAIDLRIVDDNLAVKHVISWEDRPKVPRRK